CDGADPVLGHAPRRHGRRGAGVLLRRRGRRRSGSGGGGRILGGHGRGRERERSTKGGQEEQERKGRANPAFVRRRARRRRERSGLRAGGDRRLGALDQVGADLLRPFVVDRLDRLLERLLLGVGQLRDL